MNAYFDVAFSNKFNPCNCRGWKQRLDYFPSCVKDPRHFKHQDLFHKVWVVADENMNEELDLLQIKVAHSCTFTIKDNCDSFACFLFV